MPQTEILEKKAVTGVALDTHMMHVTISYPLPDNNLLVKDICSPSKLIIWEIISTLTDPASNSLNNAVNKFVNSIV